MKIIFLYVRCIKNQKVIGSKHRLKLYRKEPVLGPDHFEYWEPKLHQNTYINEF